MADEPDPDRLRALEARLAKATVAKSGTSGETGKAFSQGEVAWRMVSELVSGLLLGLAIGFGLDFVFGTRPIFLLIFVLLGFAAGVKTMMGTARQMASDHTAKSEAGKPAGNEGD